MTLTINADRLRVDFDALAAFGAVAADAPTELGQAEARGVNRPSLSPAHLDARRWFQARAAAAGLETRVDAAANHSAVLRSPRPARPARTLLLGSHLDSVPNGGRFDGALGVLAALEALRTVQEAGLALPVHLEAIDFTDEEGTLVGELGSQALAGTLAPEALLRPRGGRAALVAGLARAGLHESRLFEARRDPATLAGYLELHIEQGPRLAHSAIAIGVVTAIVGITSYRVTFSGAANHAGTTPMDARQDAGLGAAAFTLTARELVVRDFAGCAVNVGQMRFEPGAFNIIPGRAELALEFRAPDALRLAEVEDALLSLAGVVARQHGLELELEPLGGCAPAPMDPAAQAAIAAAADSLALTHMPLVSGAGHDGQSLAPLIPCGMVFVPSRGGLSHSPLEYTAWDDCVNGANVLLRAALTLSVATAT
ncbi:MAG: Zn-dependent hydrolase [Anaerolineales bacterium]|nr:Zn-dependent hydrolase [Anaerolineales bacterium]